ncbi:MAG: NAD(P)/FAD-dependent oxidoreductase [Alphaproteobacteria bacterium]|nr:MAG: NAD(P)/FAD-dependent oxidoreductase [Alphaproteobacteria bacterium]
MQSCDVLIIGAGAAGMMCAIEAGKRGRRVVVIDHAEAPGEKIRISGGGRCNFTNLHCTPANFISKNPHFCKSALARYTQNDFIKLVDKHGIPWHEKTLGQLFCDESSRRIVNMLLAEMLGAGVQLMLETTVTKVMSPRRRAGPTDNDPLQANEPAQSVDSGLRRNDAVFKIETTRGTIEAGSLVIATGGLSIPKMGATGFGYDIARQFGLNVTETRAGLVPLLFDAELLALTKPLSGVAVDPADVHFEKTKFREALLFTHRGLSGPSILQISSYWQEGKDIDIDLLPGGDIFTELKKLRAEGHKSHLHNALAWFLPQRLSELIASQAGFDQPLTDLSDQKLRAVAGLVHKWRVTPTGTEGYRTAEVTLGGVDTDELSSKTMEATKAPGLYFIGEVVDVTGHLGGHNFQWAWSSGWCAGQYC